MKLRAWLGVALVAACTTAPAADDRFDPKERPKGGFAAVNDPVYAKECGGCHFAYLPGLLPARSWKALLAQADHFGESLSIPPETMTAIAAYLDANAGDKSDYLGEALLFRNLSENSTYTRITALPMMRRNHEVMRALMSVNGNVPVRKFTNCTDCHTGASEGSFANRELIIPSVTKVVRPGSAF
jgi:hypothetical protein